MKIKKILLTLIFPLVITGCEFNLQLYDPSDSDINIIPPTTQNGTDQKTIHVVNPSDFNGTLNYANETQPLLTKEEVYQSRVSSSVYIIVTLQDGYSLGSGVFFSEDDNYGYLLTNAHVVEGSSNIEVVYSNNKRTSASLIGYNLLEDIAVLSVAKNNNYTIPTLKTSNNLSAGEEVLAIGTPASTDFSFTATSGIISKIDSPIHSAYDSNYDLLLIQTDVSLNNGNSGGPLFDMYGNLIGINTMKLLTTDLTTNIDDINFSIPIERAIFIANSIFENHVYNRGKIGVSILDIVDLSLSDRALYNLSLEHGLLVVESSNTELLVNDIITSIGGVEFSTKIEFQKVLYDYYIGDPIELCVYRNNQYINITTTLK